MAVKPIPDGYHSITPYLTVHDGVAALDFYQRAFGAEIVLKMLDKDGRLAHGEVRIGDSVIMLSGEWPELGALSPKTLGGRTAALMLYLPDVDAAVEKAVAAGAKLTRPVADQFYGDRTGGVEDPFGHSWYLATHIADYTPEELQQRMAAAGEGQ